MRTTLTLDPDVATELEAIRREEHLSFRDVVNDVIRAGLAQRRSGVPAAARPHSYTRPMLLGSRPDIADVSGVLADLDDRRPA